MSSKENFVAGVDEVGRGPLAGPVVAAAVVLPEKHEIEGLMDSKKLTKKKRETLYPIILAKALGTGISKGINFNEIVVLNEKNGKPYIKLLDKTKKIVDKKLKIKNYKISLSLSDEDKYAVAFVTIFK